MDFFYRVASTTIKDGRTFKIRSEAGDSFGILTDFKGDFDEWTYPVFANFLMQDFLTVTAQGDASKGDKDYHWV